ncbi:MAG: hypothetical protein KAI73_10675 [Rhodospirillaceae bacterium]|nr:hypothetical protein [Rhodospirillaceae bacterium]
MTDTAEIIARATDHHLWERGDAIPNVESEQSLADAQHDSLERANDVIKSLTAAGYVIVPREPSPLRLFRGAEQTNIFDTYTVMTMPVEALEGLAGHVDALGESVRNAVIAARKPGKAMTGAEG